MAVLTPVTKFKQTVQDTSAATQKTVLMKMDGTGVAVFARKRHLRVYVGIPPLVTGTPNITAVCQRENTALEKIRKLSALQVKLHTNQNLVMKSVLRM